ncbi:MAG: AAA family ATPase [Planctomycetaceae bacterium]
MTVATTSDEPAVDSTTKVAAIRDHLNSTLRGKPEVVEMVLVCLLSRGHLLLEDKPGLGKTTLAKALADAVGGAFSRAQCTPDLLPGDITGFSIFNQKSQEFEFRRGPVFADILLADEINRATPRTQSALLEAMAERQVTVDTERYQLSDQFFVIATQNPVDQHGTYPLPEAQLDRFAMKLSVGYPDTSAELRMLQAAIEQPSDKSTLSQPILNSGELSSLQNQVAKLEVSSGIQEYMIRIASETRQHTSIVLGLSPRGLLTLQRTAQARAFLSNRNFVTPEDVQDIVYPVLAVRLGLEIDAANRVIREVLDAVAVPEYTAN